MNTLPSGQYQGRSVDDVLILDPYYLLELHDAGGYNLTPAQVAQALRNLDERDESCTCESTYDW